MNNRPIPHTPSLVARPERRLIRRSGSFRHVDFVVAASPAPVGDGDQRVPIRIGLVLDRSGSMSGEKIETAKQAVMAVVDRLDDRDAVAVTVFDDWVDIVQPLAPVTCEVKRRVRAELATIEARAGTNLRDGWLTGAREVASREPLGVDAAIARVFLLTDGQANQGVVDPEVIAAEAHAVRQSAGVGTSTFGIGADYNEALLAPLAIAGGGQFHHLRSPREIARTFVGELGELFAVAAQGVRLELELAAGVSADVVSAFHVERRPDRHIIDIGDLVADEARHVVVRCGFPPGEDGARCALRARLRWRGPVEGEGDWQEIVFRYASDTACDAEARDRDTMRAVGLHHAERARRDAAALGRSGDTSGARQSVARVAARIATYAGGDAALLETLDDLRAVEHEVAAAPLPAERAKELRYQSQRRSRGHQDHRGG